jgi:ubiquinone/menaquinone biosynthesis C-methylase UbiE
MDDKEIVKQGYNRITAVYLTTRDEQQEDVLLLSELIERLPPGAKVLDAGCGAGVPITRTLSRHFDVIGVDFSEKQLQMARQMTPQAHFICQDITTLNFPAASFDAICSYYAIIHIPREQHIGLLRDFYRMLKPSGFALLCLGAEDNPDDHDSFYGTPMYWSHYDAATNLRLLSDAGFDLIWSRLVTDSTAPPAAHLFVLAQKG